MERNCSRAPPISLFLVDAECGSPIGVTSRNRSSLLWESTVIALYHNQHLKRFLLINADMVFCHAKRKHQGILPSVTQLSDSVASIECTGRKDARCMLQIKTSSSMHSSHMSSSIEEMRPLQTVQAMAKLPYLTIVSDNVPEQLSDGNDLFSSADHPWRVEFHHASLNSTSSLSVLLTAPGMCHRTRDRSGDVDNVHCLPHFATCFKALLRGASRNHLRVHQVPSRSATHSVSMICGLGTAALPVFSRGSVALARPSLAPSSDSVSALAMRPAQRRRCPR